MVASGRLLEFCMKVHENWRGKICAGGPGGGKGASWFWALGEGRVDDAHFLGEHESARRHLRCINRRVQWHRMLNEVGDLVELCLDHATVAGFIVTPCQHSRIPPLYIWHMINTCWLMRP